jgi:hypothetical protein
MPLSASACAMKSLSVRSLLTQAPPWHLQRRREWPVAARTIEPGEQRPAAGALIFDILDRHHVAGLARDRVRRMRRV